MGLPVIESSLTALVLDGAEEIIKLLWHHYAGESSSEDAQKAMAAVRDASISAFSATVHAAIEAELCRRGMAMALDDLADGAQHVLDAFTPKGTIPSLGLPIGEVSELPLEQDDIPTKPGK